MKLFVNYVGRCACGKMVSEASRASQEACAKCGRAWKAAGQPNKSREEERRRAQAEKRR